MEMTLVLLYLFLAIIAFLEHHSGNMLVAAYEDLGVSIPGSSDISFLDADSILDLNNEEEPFSFLDSNLGAGDQEDIFNDIPVSPLPAYVDIPQTSAFNVYPPPEGFNPCPQGLKYACCLESGFYMPYPLSCIWYDYDVTVPELKEYMCQEEYIYCCGDIVNAGLNDDGRVGNEGIDCELATQSAFKKVEPEQQNQPDWSDMILKILTYPHPLFRIPPPVTSPEGS